MSMFYDSGAVAQLVRAPALQAGGRRFDADRLHNCHFSREKWWFCCVFLFSMLFFSLLPSYAMANETSKHDGQVMSMSADPLAVEKVYNTPYALGIYGLFDVSFVGTFGKGTIALPPSPINNPSSFAGPYILDGQLGLALGLHIYDDAPDVVRGVLGLGVCLIAERCTWWLQGSTLAGLIIGVRLSQDEGTLVLGVRYGGALLMGISYGNDVLSFGPYVEGNIYDFYLQEDPDMDAMQIGLGSSIEVGLQTTFLDILFLRLGYQRHLSQHDTIRFPKDAIKMTVGVMLGGVVAGQRRGASSIW